MLSGDYTPELLVLWQSRGQSLRAQTRVVLLLSVASDLSIDYDAACGLADRASEVSPECLCSLQTSECLDFENRFARREILPEMTMFEEK